jgi:hypothetical protein
MPTGSAANPMISTSHSADVMAKAEIPRAPHTAAPLASHLSCWRRSSDDPRQLTTWRTAKPTHSAKASTRQEALHVI